MSGFVVALSADQKAEARRIAVELAALARTGKILPGSLTSRLTHCGRPGCKCMADPPRPHGPYWQWTRKVAAKTVTRWLSPDQAGQFQAWIDNDRRARELLGRLEAIGIAALEAEVPVARR